MVLKGRYAVALVVAAMFFESVLAADFDYAPPVRTNNGSQYVPVDILNVDATWKILADMSKVEATAKVEFSTRDQGQPFLLLNPNATAKLVLNGTTETLTVQRMTGPGFELFERANYHALSRSAGIPAFTPGTYTMEVEYSFVPNAEQALFLTNNYHSHSFVEAGIPCNLHYDHFPVKLQVSVVGSTIKKFRLISNGEVTEQARNQFTANFGSHFHSMAIFVDFVAVDTVIRNEFEFVTTLEDHLPLEQRRRINVEVYGTTTDSSGYLVGPFRDLINSEFARLEEIFGRFPYDRYIFKAVNRSRKGGGAYAGAAALQDFYVSIMLHEIGHSYFMASVSPGHGNDQWIYEGIGQWAPTYLAGPEKDPRFEKSLDLLINPYAISQNGTLNPATPRASAHRTGRALMAGMETRLRAQGKGGLLGYLRQIHTAKAGQTMNTREFKQLIEGLTGVDMTDLFDYYFIQY